MRHHGGGLNAPFLGLLVCLFVLSLMAPRSWERVARQKPLGRLPSVRQHAAGESFTSRQLASRGPQVVRRTLGEPRLATRRVQGPQLSCEWNAGHDTLELVAATTAVTELRLPELTTGATQVDDEFACEPLSVDGPRLTLALRPTPIADDANVRLDGTFGELEAAWDLPPASTGRPTQQKGPQTLYDRLARLAERPGCTLWSLRVAALVRELFGAASMANYARQMTVLEHLAAATRDAESLAELVGEGTGASDVRRARYALERRMELWQTTAAVRRTAPSLVIAPRPDADDLRARLGEVAALANGSEQGTEWREYLMLDALERAGAPPAARGNQRELARKVLDRLDEVRLTRSQRSFVSHGPVAALAESLRGCAAEPVDIERTLAHLEQYERSGLSHDAQLVTADRQHLAWNDSDEAQQLAHLIETHYRNCNLRVAVAEELIERLLPTRDPQREAVRETILGVPVRGQGTTTTQLSVQLVPDNARLQMAIEAAGLIDSRTTSQSGPARFWNDGHANYSVRALVNVTPAGIRLGDVDGHVSVATRLRNFETDYDGIPLVGSLVRSIVEREYGARRGAARRESERKVMARVEDRITEEASELVAKANRQFDERVRNVLSELGFDTPASALQTTDKRLIARLRLATDEQLGSHTPRPRAPSDSLLSLQVHESAMNNLVRQLDLDGRQFSVPELHKWIALKLHMVPPVSPDASREEVYVTFADTDAVRVRCQHDRIEITLALADVENPEHHWRNFEVKVFYRPQADGLSAQLVRDGTIQLSGYGLGAAGQVGLRGVFSRMFSREKPLRLLPESLVDDERLADLSVTQLVIEDGWIGLAVGPRRSTSTLPVALAPRIEP